MPPPTHPRPSTNAARRAWALALLVAGLLAAPSIVSADPVWTEEITAECARWRADVEDPNGAARWAIDMPLFSADVTSTKCIGCSVPPRVGGVDEESFPLLTDSTGQALEDASITPDVATHLMFGGFCPSLGPNKNCPPRPRHHCIASHEESFIRVS